MKKASSLFVLVMLLFFPTFAGISLIKVRAPNGDHIHNLDTGLSYATIQEAINASETLDGHTIHVDAGTYCENIVVNKELILIGEGAEVTIISAADSSINALNVTSSNVNISGFTITGATEWYPSAFGVFLNCVGNVSLTDNYVTGNTYGIRLEDSDDNIIVNNIVHSNYFGIDLELGSSYNMIAENNVSSNSYYGIILWSSSDENIVTGNIVVDDFRGITLGYSELNVIAYNNVSDNSYIGIEIQAPCNDNAIYHNNIIDNHVQAYSAHEAFNIWDDGYPSGGNYWSNYAGADILNGPDQDLTGSDGIGDGLHFIDANNTDNYPLMAPISIFNAGIWEGVPHSIDVVSNSTISNFQLNATQKKISFSVIGETDSGFCRVTVPNTIVQYMWQDDYTVLVDGQPVEFRDWVGVENTYIYFTYQHSTKEVIIIPEFSSALFLLLTIFALVVAAQSKRKQLPGEPN